MSESILIAGVLAAGILCQWVGWRLKIPAILPLLAVGVLVGPVLNWLHPQETLGELFFPLVSFAVAIILFEGALTLAWREVRAVASTVRNLLVIGALITWFGVRRPPT
ncbi:MAG: cation:proton antiporter [Caldilineaceae bacterium]|nr:cation:proton antiporter [Caldilineaceae bacterium]